MANVRLGCHLHPDDQRYVLAAYVHRYTGDHTPGWATVPRECGGCYPMQFTNDQEWLAHTRFRVRQDGRLDGRVHCCESNATWPNGKA